MDGNGDDDLFADLQALSASAFPKRCPTCGRVYTSEADFIARTQPLEHSSGLKAGEDDAGHTLVELYRNCICGSTLLDFFDDRRDDSDDGGQRRTAFARLLTRLSERGVPAATARSELLVVANGGTSALIERLIGHH